MDIEEQRHIHSFSDDESEEDFRTVIRRAYQRRLLMWFDCWDVLLRGRYRALLDRLIRPGYERSLVIHMKKFINNIGQYKDPYEDAGTVGMVGSLETIIAEWAERLRRGMFSNETVRSPGRWLEEHSMIERKKFEDVKIKNFEELKMWMKEYNMDEYFQGPDIDMFKDER